METFDRPEHGENMLANSLVKIGEKLRNASNKEVPNKVVVSSLVSVGVAALCADVAFHLQGNRMVELVETLDKFAQTAVNTGHHQAAVEFLDSAIQANNTAIDSYTKSAHISAILAAEVAVIGGIDIPKIMKDKSVFANINGTTKISTIGVAVGELLVKAGNHFNKK